MVMLCIPEKNKGSFHFYRYNGELLCVVRVIKKLANVFRIWEIALLVAFSSAGLGMSQEKLPTNLELLSSVVDEIVKDGMRQCGIDSDSKVFLHQLNGESEVTRFILDRYVQGLLKRGVEIYTKADSVDEGVFLSLIVTKASVSYDGISRRNFLGEGWVGRRAEVTLSVQAVNNRSRKVEWAGDLHGNMRDRIPLSKLNIVEQGGFILGKPERPRQRGIRKWIEPIVVLGTIGGVAYLFYSIRSR